MLAEKFSPVITTGVRLGHTAFYVGAILPLIVGTVTAALIAIQQIRNCRRITPLWAAITGEFSDLAYRGARGIGGKFYRREVEIRDGLVLLEDYYDPEVARRMKETDPDDEVAVAVALIRSALRARRAGRPVLAPYHMPTSGATNRDEDVSWLLRVADGFAEAEDAEGRFAARL